MTTLRILGAMLTAALLMAAPLPAGASEPSRPRKTGMSITGMSITGVSITGRGSVGHAVLSEVRIGLGFQDSGSPESGTINLSGLVLFNRPFVAGGGPSAFVPMPHIGHSLNLAGKTSHLHAGLTWQLDLGRHLFIEASLGAAVHDGQVGRRAAIGRNALGCRALFRESVGVGYRFERGWTFTLSVEHLSNGGRCDANRGLTNAGVMLGYRF